MCILSFSFPHCSLSDGREVSGEGGDKEKRRKFLLVS